MRTHAPHHQRIRSPLLGGSASMPSNDALLASVARLLLEDLPNAALQDITERSEAARAAKEAPPPPTRVAAAPLLMNTCEGCVVAEVMDSSLVLTQPLHASASPPIPLVSPSPSVAPVAEGVGGKAARPLRFAPLSMDAWAAVLVDAESIHTCTPAMAEGSRGGVCDENSELIRQARLRALAVVFQLLNGATAGWFSSPECAWALGDLWPSPRDSSPLSAEGETLRAVVALGRLCRAAGLLSIQRLSDPAAVPSPSAVAAPMARLAVLSAVHRMGAWLRECFVCLSVGLGAHCSAWGIGDDIDGKRSSSPLGNGNTLSADIPAEASALLSPQTIADAFDCDDEANAAIAAPCKEASSDAVDIGAKREEKEDDATNWGTDCEAMASRRFVRQMALSRGVRSRDALCLLAGWEAPAPRHTTSLAPSASAPTAEGAAESAPPQMRGDGDSTTTAAVGDGEQYDCAPPSPSHKPEGNTTSNRLSRDGLRRALRCVAVFLAASAAHLVEGNSSSKRDGDSSGLSPPLHAALADVATVEPHRLLPVVSAALAALFCPHPLLMLLSGQHNSATAKDPCIMDSASLLRQGEKRLGVLSFYDHRGLSAASEGTGSSSSNTDSLLATGALRLLRREGIRCVYFERSQREKGRRAAGALRGEEGPRCCGRRGPCGCACDRSDAAIVSFAAFGGAYSPARGAAPSEKSACVCRCDGALDSHQRRVYSKGRPYIRRLREMAAEAARREYEAARAAERARHAVTDPSQPRPYYARAEWACPDALFAVGDDEDDEDKSDDGDDAYIGATTCDGANRHNDDNSLRRRAGPAPPLYTLATTVMDVCGVADAPYNAGPSVDSAAAPLPSPPPLLRFFLRRMVMADDGSNGQEEGSGDDFASPSSAAYPHVNSTCKSATNENCVAANSPHPRHQGPTHFIDMGPDGAVVLFGSLSSHCASPSSHAAFAGGEGAGGGANNSARSADGADSVANAISCGHLKVTPLPFVRWEPAVVLAPSAVTPPLAGTAERGLVVEAAATTNDSALVAKAVGGVSDEDDEDVPVKTELPHSFAEAKVTSESSRAVKAEEDAAPSSASFPSSGTLAPHQTEAAPVAETFTPKVAPQLAPRPPSPDALLRSAMRVGRTLRQAANANGPQSQNGATPQRLFGRPEEKSLELSPYGALQRSDRGLAVPPLFVRPTGNTVFTLTPSDLFFACPSDGTAARLLPSHLLPAPALVPWRVGHHPLLPASGPAAIDHRALEEDPYFVVALAAMGSGLGKKDKGSAGRGRAATAQRLLRQHQKQTEEQHAAAEAAAAASLGGGGGALPSSRVGGRSGATRRGSGAVANSVTGAAPLPSADGQRSVPLAALLGSAASSKGGLPTTPLLRGGAGVGASAADAKGSAFRMGGGEETVPLPPHLLYQEEGAAAGDGHSSTRWRNGGAAEVLSPPEGSLSASNTLRSPLFPLLRVSGGPSSFAAANAKGRGAFSKAAPQQQQKEGRPPIDVDAPADRTATTTAYGFLHSHAALPFAKGKGLPQSVPTTPVSPPLGPDGSPIAAAASGPPRAADASGGANGGGGISYRRREAAAVRIAMGASRWANGRGEGEGVGNEGKDKGLASFASAGALSTADVICELLLFAGASLSASSGASAVAVTSVLAAAAGVVAGSERFPSHCVLVASSTVSVYTPVEIAAADAVVPTRPFEGTLSTRRTHLTCTIRRFTLSGPSPSEARASLFDAAAGVAWRALWGNLSSSVLRIGADASLSGTLSAATASKHNAAVSRLNGDVLTAMALFSTGVVCPHTTAPLTTATTRGAPTALIGGGLPLRMASLPYCASFAVSLAEIRRASIAVREEMCGGGGGGSADGDGDGDGDDRRSGTLAMAAYEAIGSVGGSIVVGAAWPPQCRPLLPPSRAFTNTIQRGINTPTSGAAVSRRVLSLRPQPSTSALGAKRPREDCGGGETYAHINGEKAFVLEDRDALGGSHAPPHTCAPRTEATCRVVVSRDAAALRLLADLLLRQR